MSVGKLDRRKTDARQNDERIYDSYPVWRARRAQTFFHFPHEWIVASGSFIRDYERGLVGWIIFVAREGIIKRFVTRQCKVVSGTRAASQD